MTSELRPAVEVWRGAVYDYGGASIEGTEVKYRAAAVIEAVIEADRAAIIAAKDAEIAAVQAHADALAGALRHMFEAVCGETGFAQAVRDESGVPYPWPALDYADAETRQALRAYEESRR